jgi:hypothetical protein
MLIGELLRNLKNVCKFTTEGNPLYFVTSTISSDLDVGVHGSGFPMQPEELKNASGWNLNVFPKLADSLLSHLDESTAGVSEPMM